jgi:hypothetical protein
MVVINLSKRGGMSGRRRVVFCAFALAFLMMVGDVSPNQAVPPGNPGFCPLGHRLLARYDWDGTDDAGADSERIGKYIFDSGKDIISFNPYPFDIGPDAHLGSWQSEQPVHAFVLVSGHHDGERLIDTYILPVGTLQADFTNEGVMDKGISHIDFCERDEF